MKTRPITIHCPQDSEFSIHCPPDFESFRRACLIQSISADYLDFTIDDNKLKQEKFIPGTGIQIKNINRVDKESYDFVTLLNVKIFR